MAKKLNKYKSLAGPITINDITYHRNGVAGEGFWGVSFTWKDEVGPQSMFATVFNPSDNYERVQTAVINLNHLAFRYRGDDFHVALSKAIIEQGIIQ